MYTNGTSDHTGSENVAGTAAALAPGIYVPTVAFFTPEDEIDVAATRKHTIRLAAAGAAGLVTHGSNGEAVHLDAAERLLVTRTTRAALDEAGFTSMPLIVGCGAQSTRETVKLCLQAKAAGGTHVLILPPAYYGSLLSRRLILEHFRTVADRSPLPVLVYNFPAACGGLDLDSDLIVELAGHANIVGVKLTCGNTGKLARVVAATASTGFRTFGGSVDFTLQTLAVGGHGIIGGLGNLAPRTCVELLRLGCQGEKKEQAQRLQAIAARGDWVAIKGGFVSVKAGLEKYYGYGGEPRSPCAFPEGEELSRLEEGFRELVETERGLERSAV